MLYYFNNHLSLYHNQRTTHDQLCSTNQRVQDSPLKKDSEFGQLLLTFRLYDEEPTAANIWYY
jgi:hypothetical protein